jgi:succinate-acetate transporter protein
MVLAYSRWFNVLRLLRLLQYLYPSAYRNRYGDEMLHLSTEMINNAHSIAEYNAVQRRLLADCFKSLFNQWTEEIRGNIYGRPAYIRYGSFFAILLFVPYMTVCMYNIINQLVFDRRSIPFYVFEAHHWVIYTVALPLASLVLIVSLLVVRLLSVLLGTGEQIEMSEVSVDALLFGLPLTLITTLVLL